jgi:hypothetical protein
MVLTKGRFDSPMTRAVTVLPFVQFGVFLSELDILGIDAEQRRQPGGPAFEGGKRGARFGESGRCHIGNRCARTIDDRGLRLAEQCDGNRENGANEQ